MSIRDEKLATGDDVVGFYSREFYPLSNFSAYVVQWNEERWPTAEHAYQAAKFIDNNREIADKIKEASSPYKAKQIAHEYKDEVNDSFYENNVMIMKEICKQKLQQHEHVQEKLLQTGDREIVEDSPTDDFWGWGSNQDGENKLGKIWMNLRDKLQTENHRMVED